MVDGDGPEPEEGTYKEIGTSCKKPEPDEPKHMMGEGNKDEGAEVATMTGVSEEEAGTTAGEGRTAHAAGGRTGRISYTSVSE